MFKKVNKLIYGQKRDRAIRQRLNARDGLPTLRRAFGLTASLVSSSFVWSQKRLAATLKLLGFISTRQCVKGLGTQIRDLMIGE